MHYNHTQEFHWTTLCFTTRSPSKVSSNKCSKVWFTFSEPLCVLFQAWVTGLDQLYSGRYFLHDHGRRLLSALVAEFWR